MKNFYSLRRNNGEFPCVNERRRGEFVWFYEYRSQYKMAADTLLSVATKAFFCYFMFMMNGRIVIVAFKSTNQPFNEWWTAVISSTLVVLRHGQRQGDLGTSLKFLPPARVNDIFAMRWTGNRLFLRMASSHLRRIFLPLCSSPCPTKIVTDTYLNEFSNSMASPTVSCFSTDSTFSPCLFEGDTEISYKSSWNKISGKIFFRANSKYQQKKYGSICSLTYISLCCYSFQLS